MMAHKAAKGAVSHRRIRGPTDTEESPFSMAKAASSWLKPPSGPVSTAKAESCLLSSSSRDRDRLFSFSYKSNGQGLWAISSTAWAKSITGPTCTTRPRKDCLQASRAILFIRASFFSRSFSGSLTTQ